MRRLERDGVAYPTRVRAKGSCLSLVYTDDAATTPTLRPSSSTSRSKATKWWLRTCAGMAKVKGHSRATRCRFWTILLRRRVGKSHPISRS